MEGHSRISIILLIVAGLHNATPSNTKEARKVGLLIPEKISTIIDIVHSHKNKPAPAPAQTTFQQTQVTSQQYQPAPAYQPQYPNYQYPPNQGSYQSQYQSQYQNQYAAGYQPQGNYNYQNYPSNPAPAYQGPVQQPSYGTSQSQGQGQYQNTYPQNQGNQYQSQNQQSGQYQNQNANQNQGNYQGTSNQQSGGQYVSNQQTSQFTQGQGSSGSQTSHVGSGKPGPTCICQAWSKPEAGTNEIPAQKAEETTEIPSAE